MSGHPHLVYTLLLGDRLDAWLGAAVGGNALGARAQHRLELPLLIALRLEVFEVLHGGRVTEQGTHDELLARGGEYAAMVKVPSLACH